MKTPKLLCTIAAIALAQGSLFAVNTDPVGFVSFTVLGNSDATLAVPMNRTSEFKGLTSALSGTSGSVTITVAGTPGWTAGQFAPLATANKTYALQLASGAKEGLVLPITNNGTNTVTVTVSASDNLTGVLASGEQIDIMPYWTPATLFPTPPPVGSELIGFANPDNGVNVGASEVYQYAGSNAWEDGINGGSATHAPLQFGTSFILRNAGASTITLSLVGGVPMTAHRIRISTQANNTEQDVAIGYMSPIAERLSTIGLPAYNPADPTNSNNLKQGQVASANALGFPVATGDSIIGFDNNEPGINKGAAEVYQWTGSAFEDQINGGIITNSVTLKPGFGYIFRKAATPTPTTVVWTHLQGYRQ